MRFLTHQLGTKLREERKRRNLSQAEVGEGIGTSSSYISQLENGERKPSLENYLALISFFGVDFTYFLNTEDNDKEIVGREIKALREKRGWSIGELRDRSGVDFFRIGRAENGEIELSKEELERIADAFGIDINYFFCRYEFNVSRIINSCKSLGLTDNQIHLVVEFINDCLKTNKL
ncbi:hypothetical protein BBF96_03305 [Anoxybacter fermentans]|uniref:HTH cro/C1-type domain-containing protein n=1 Tax=Anoxybacter fermentans TaxID=1323375 RepID=A0A3S9SW54_9FIRM|nr:helix-turn-helix domain-containing protein [Anoxybacter fermentans]AZR72492.1 hypothetical protein BBF96_03305 [Anoxybacter fermentans]